MAALDPGRRHLAFVPCSELGARSIAIGHRICFALVVGTPRPGPSFRLWTCDLAAIWRLPNLGNLAPTILHPMVLKYALTCYVRDGSCDNLQNSYPSAHSAAR